MLTNPDRVTSTALLTISQMRETQKRSKLGWKISGLNFESHKRALNRQKHKSRLR